MQRSLLLYVDYARLALMASRRMPAVTALIVLAVAVGIGGCMSVLTLYRAMSRDPIPSKSAQLFVPQIETRPPSNRGIPGELPDQLSYRDSQALLALPVTAKQVAMYPFGLVITPIDPDTQPFHAQGRATSAAFFSIFDVPFQFGGAWDTRADSEAANVVVLSASLNDRLFGGANSIGRTMTLGNRDYRIVGVLRPWKLLPRLYDLVNGPYSDTESVFMPMATAIDRQIAQTSDTTCASRPEPGWAGLLNSECLWIQHWVELPTRSQQDQFQSSLRQYALAQQRSGRFAWTPAISLHDAREWLKAKKVVSTEIRVLVILGFGFLAVCLLNAVGLILAQFQNQAAEFGIRRALGAARTDVLSQCLVHAATIGLAGGVAGLIFTAIGLSLQRMLLPQQMRALAHVDGMSVALVIGMALFATVITAAYPAWRASRSRLVWEA